MLLKLNRTQTTAIGVLRAGVPYAFDMRKAAHKAVAERLLDRKFAVKLDEKDLAAALEDDAALQAAALADRSEGRRVNSAIAERLAVREAEEREAAAKKEAEGGDSDDTVEGGDGADTTEAGDGADTTEGGGGADTTEGGDGADTAEGGDGADTTAAKPAKGGGKGASK